MFFMITIIISKIICKVTFIHIKISRQQLFSLTLSQFITENSSAVVQVNLSSFTRSKSHQKCGMK